MRLVFKRQQYQTDAVDSVVDCFEQQPYTRGTHYLLDSGDAHAGAAENGQQTLMDVSCVRNAEVVVSDITDNIRKVQERQNLPPSRPGGMFRTLTRGEFEEDPAYTEKALAIAPHHLDVEMETGTGKTYCYIKTVLEMNRRYGWTKFIVVVPSIAIREGVYKSLQITAEHFLEEYGKKARFFVYNSKRLHDVEGFASDSGINVMVINVQAFNSRSKDNRRIHKEQDSFQSRRPIDVIKATRPILILDEPQKMEGARTLESLKEFDAMFVIRYSATHKTLHHKVHRLDALDAYEQKLVKRIAVRGVSVKGLTGTNAYLYLERIIVSRRAPVVRMEFEVKQGNEVKRTTRNFKGGDDLYELSGKMAQYKGFVISDISAITNTVDFANGHQVHVGEATGNVEEAMLRRIQIREAINAHFEKERALYEHGIKVLSLFFIDSVAKYRLYTDVGEEGGEYAKVFEEEYSNALSEVMKDRNLPSDYKEYLKGIAVERTHNGYFSIDRESKRMKDPVIRQRTNETDDVEAYDLILKDKERLLSFAEPTRFIFSHSALREGWDNPNVFVICALKHSDSTVSRRQEVGRGLRLCVNQHGERQDSGAVHDTNVLTVVAAESYTDFVAALQKDISEAVSSRPREADALYFFDKIVRSEEGEELVLNMDMAKRIEYYLIQNGYVDHCKYIVQKYHDALAAGQLADLPENLRPYKAWIVKLIEALYSESKLPQVENERNTQTNRLNANFEKKEFKELWSRINRKAAYTVHFSSAELVKKCIQALNKGLRVAPLQYVVQRGEQRTALSPGQLESGGAFEIKQTAAEYKINSIHSAVKYDLVGDVARETQLTRATVAKIFSGIEEKVFGYFGANPEKFMSESIRIIQEQKATVIVEHLAYNVSTGKYDTDIFTHEQRRLERSRAGNRLKRHIYDYVVADSKVERNFVNELDTYTDVVVYAKLPKGFAIPTPVGNYNPDWAISFKEGSVKHIYFVAETKGSMSSMELRKIEATKIECARKFFDKINRKIDTGKVKYDMVDSFGRLLEIVGAVK